MEHHLKAASFHLGESILRNGNPWGAYGAFASEVTVAYQTMPVIPIPGLTMATFTVTRMVQMRAEQIGSLTVAARCCVGAAEPRV